MSDRDTTGMQGAEPERRPATFRAVLRHGEFRSLWLAELQSVTGDQLARVALSILVFDRTNSAGLTALTYALTYVPDLVSGPLLGGLADRYPRRRAMVASDITRAALVAMMAVPGVPLVVLAGLLVMVQLFAAPFAAAQTATLRVALDDTRFPVALATRQTTVQVGQMLGFALGGGLVAFLGVHTALAVDAVTFLLSAALIQFGVRPRTAPVGAADDPESHLGRIWAGAKVVLSDPTLRTIAFLAWLAIFMIVPEGLAAVYAAEIDAGPGGVGLLLAAHPAGYVLAAIVVARLLTLTQQQRYMGVLAVAAMLPLLAFAAQPPLPLAMLLLAVCGACGTYQIGALATFATLVPDRWRGQAFGWVGSVLIGVQGLGIVGGGVLAQALDSAALAITIAGVTGLLVGIVVSRGWRRHRPAPPSPINEPDDSPDSPGQALGRSPGQTATRPSDRGGLGGSAEPGQAE